jgi:RimJ/RimL family protein N-acetyltransferase
MILRKVTIEDAKILLDWRNDPMTRAQSINGGEIKPEDHLVWLQKSLSNPDRFLFIATDETGALFGNCRIDKELEDGREIYELSWTIAPEWRGKGLGKTMLGELLKETVLKGKRLKAVIKRDNVASAKIAERFGFRLIGAGDLTNWYLSN